MDRIEPLEARQLLAGVTITNAGNGLIRVAGTSGNDHVDVAFFGKDQYVVTDGTTTEYFDRSVMTRVTFVGGDGNDLITLGRVPVRAYLEGGLGNDSLSASQSDANDTLIGGEGNDYLFAGPGDDSLDGGNGGDFMIGNLGNDFLQCKSEVNTDDTVSGGKGNDKVSLSTYPGGTTTTIGKRNKGLQLVITDTLYGDVESLDGSSKNDIVYDFSNRGIVYDLGAGDDVLFAGIGPDTVMGGLGKDSILASGGDDMIYVAGDNAIDTVVGGAGVDSASYDDDDVLKSVDKRIEGTVNV